MRILLLFFLLFPAIAIAQLSLFKDIYSGYGSSIPLWPTEFRGKLCFVAADTQYGRELMYLDAEERLWQTGNTDIGYSGSRLNKRGFSMIEMEGSLYFQHVKCDTCPDEIAVWNGSGTAKTISEITGDLTYSTRNPSYLTAYEGKLYFIRDTEPGTYLGSTVCSYDPKTKLTVIYSGAIPVNKANECIGQLVVFKGKLIFNVDNGPAGTRWQVYQYDLSTKQASTIPGNGTIFRAGYYNPTIINDKLYFLADAIGFGMEMFEYDGINPPKRITDIAEGLYSSFLTSLGPIGIKFQNEIYFSATAAKRSGDYNLYRYSPTSGNVTLVHDFKYSNSRVYNYLIHDDKLFFTARDKEHGIELWCHEGGSKPTKIYAEITPGENIAGYILECFTYRKKLYAIATNFDASVAHSPYGIELYRVNWGLRAPELLRLNYSSVFPNPAQSHTNIHFSLAQAATLKINLISIDGRVVYQSINNYVAGANSVSLPMHSLIPGGYTYNITGDGILMTGKVQKQ